MTEMHGILVLNVEIWLETMTMELGVGHGTSLVKRKGIFLRKNGRILKRDGAQIEISLLVVERKVCNR